MPRVTFLPHEKTISVPEGESLEQFFLEIVSMCHYLLYVAVFGFEIGDNLRVVALIHPVIVVDADLTVCFQSCGVCFCHGWLGRLLSCYG